MRRRLSSRPLRRRSRAAAAVPVLAASRRPTRAPFPAPRDLFQELYDHNVPGGNYIDGAFFGTTYPHLFLQTFRELRPPPPTQRYVPRVFGFKVHKVEEQALAPVGREEWPKRPKNEPVSDWDS